MATEQREKWRKLAALANFLDDLPHDRFHMPSWSDQNATDASCGTAACACGWAATVFRREGWSFNGGPFGSPSYTSPLGVRLTGRAAFANFFGLSAPDSDHITCDFMAYYHDFGVRSEGITPRMAAARIREVLAKYDATVLDEPCPLILIPTPETAHVQ